ncbi:MAG: MFS transporter [Clostridia bacterium]|nr:MFS transporter [Clostridia bacterium]
MDNQKIEIQKKKFDYKWVIIAASFLMVFTCLGFCSSTKSFFIGPITTHLGVDRSVYSINDSLRFITVAVVNLFFGPLVTKFGPRKLIAAGFFSLTASMLSYALAEHVLVLYLGGILLGIGLSWTTTTMVGYVVNIWSKENKGTIMGAVLAANGVGGALAVQIVSPIIESNGRILGYKLAYFVIAIILLSVGTIVVSVYRDRPKNADPNAPVAPHQKKRRGQSWVGIDADKVRKQWFFWGALGCIFFTGFVLQAINGVAVQHMKDVGLDAAYVTNVWSCHSIALACFKFLTGFVYDKKGLRTTVNICSITAIFVMISLALVTPTPTGKILALVYALFSSLALPLETIMLPIYANDLFGEAAFKKTLGLFVSVNTAGYALAAPLMNLCYDLLGSYRFGLILSGIIMVFIIIALQFIITSANRMKRQIIAAEINNQ